MSRKDRFIREIGKPTWHVRHTDGKDYVNQARCGVSFDPRYYAKQSETANKLTPTQQRCGRKGCAGRFYD